MRLLKEHPQGFDPARPWEQQGETVRQDSRLFRQVVARRRSPHTGHEHAFYRLHGPDWVNVIAFTPPGPDGPELLVVEQFRHGIDEATLEIPGGSCDPGEAPLFSAQRELREETGHASRRWYALGWCSPNPATLTNRCHTYLALDCEPDRAGELRLDPAEELRLWAFRWSEWEARMRSGEVHHALVLAAFLKLNQWEGWAHLRSGLS